MNETLMFFKVGDKGYVHMQPFPFSEQNKAKSEFLLERIPNQDIWQDREVKVRKPKG
jgi:hypothetical protein